KELIPDGVLTQDTRLVLVNSLYLKAPWKVPFELGMTRDADFHVSDAETVAVRMMSADISHAPVLFADEYTLVSLPFHDGDLSMDFVMPVAGVSLAEFRQGFGSTELESAVNAASAQRIYIHLPRFRVESEIGLSDPLKALGMPLAFTEGQADF